MSDDLQTEASSCFTKRRRRGGYSYRDRADGSRRGKQRGENRPTTTVKGAGGRWERKKEERRKGEKEERR
eukprot:3109095-Pleurochrysis_carterae.AAC.1